MGRLVVVLALLLPCALSAEQVSRSWSPRTAEEAGTLRLGLALRSFREGGRNGGTVLQ